MEPNDPNRPDDLKAGTITPPGPPNGGTPPDNGAAPAPPPLSLTGWLLNNFLYVLIVAAIGYLLYRGGLDWLLRAGLVVVGLGFIIFVHELGHFLAAKWCDVHVQTFSIGFGPALPGCSFVRGETTYKIAVLPLGGYVNMVGEGPEADEDENYPRSFKNKSVLQRMLIISAGVIMNMIFAAIVFVTVYLTVGERRPTAVIAETDSGSPAWQKGVRPGWKIVEVGGRKTDYFDDVQVKVSVVSKGKAVAFRFEALPGVPEAPADAIDLVPHRDANNMAPVVGLIAASRLKLPGEARKKNYASPVAYFSAAASARSFELDDIDVPVASTDPGSDGLTPLPKDKDPWQELCARLRKAETGDPFTVKVRGKDGKEREVQAGLGFDYGDSILATTDPATPDRPFNVKPLAVDANHEEAQFADPLDFRRRMLELKGKPAVVRVKRDKSSSESGFALVLVPPAYHATFGMRMKMGEVVAVREGSPAEKAGVQQQDVIEGAELRFDGGKWEKLAGPIDPVRLPDDLYNHVHKDPKRDPNKWQVRLTVKRHPEHEEKLVTLAPMDWDDSWKPGDDGPLTPASPLAIPQLGLAYRIDSMVLAVTPGSPADKAGIKAGDEIRAIRVRMGGKTPAVGDAEWSNWREMKNKVKGGNVYDQWAFYFDVVQQSDFQVVQVEVYRANVHHSSPELKAEPDMTWPMADRGISLSQDTRRQKASGLIEAVRMGLDKTWRVTQYIYSILSSVVTGQISTKGMGGPVAIAGGAFAAAQDVSMFLLLLGVISINLAVVNFLPIPILDGGHMVFLIYEGVRGKPPPESVRVIATYVGLILILFLMIFVFYNDLERLGVFEWLRWFRK